MSSLQFFSETLQRFALWLNRRNNGLNFTAAVTLLPFLVAVICAIQFGA